MFQPFFTHLSKNRSIEQLQIEPEFPDLTDDVDTLFENLAPFFEFNYKLRCIIFSSLNCNCTNIQPLCSALHRMNSNRLEMIHLEDCDIDDDGLTCLIDAFISMPGLHILADLHLQGNNIGNDGCKKLSELLENPSSGIQRLGLQDNEFDDAGLAIIVSALLKNNTLKSLHLSRIGVIGRKLTPKSWGHLSRFLESPSCLLEELFLMGDPNVEDNYCVLDDDGATYLGQAFAINNTQNP